MIAEEHTPSSMAAFFPLVRRHRALPALGGPSAGKGCNPGTLGPRFALVGDVAILKGIHQCDKLLLAQKIAASFLVAWVLKNVIGIYRQVAPRNRADAAGILF